MSPPPEPGHRPAIPAIAFLLVGLLVGEEAGRPPDVSDAARTGRPPVPTFGFRSVPGILEAGDGWPRDALHLVATGPLRGSGAEGVPDFLKDRITLNLELVGRFGGSLPKDIFAFGTNARGPAGKGHFSSP